MTFPVLVESHDEQFEAILMGTPHVRAVEQTRLEAIASLKTKIRQSLESGELCLLELEPTGLAGLAGKYEADPTLSDICEEAYLARKAACPP